MDALWACVCPTVFQKNQSINGKRKTIGNLIWKPYNCNLTVFSIFSGIMCGKRTMCFLHYFSVSYRNTVFQNPRKTTLGQKSIFYLKIHMLEFAYFKKFTISKSIFLQNSHFENPILNKNLIFQNLVYSQ